MRNLSPIDVILNGLRPEFGRDEIEEAKLKKMDNRFPWVKCPNCHKRYRDMGEIKCPWCKGR